MNTDIKNIIVVPRLANVPNMRTKRRFTRNSLSKSINTIKTSMLRLFSARPAFCKKLGLLLQIYLPTRIYACGRTKVLRTSSMIGHGFRKDTSEVRIIFLNLRYRIITSDCINIETDVLIIRYPISKIFRR